LRRGAWHRFQLERSGAELEARCLAPISTSDGEGLVARPRFGDGACFGVGRLGCVSDRQVGPVRPIRTGRKCVAERERRLAPPFGGVFVARSQVLDSDQITRSLTRIAHEVSERNRGLESVVLVGLQTGGVPIAERLAEIIFDVEGTKLPVGTLDVALYRDDIGLRPVLPEAATSIPLDLDSMVVVLVDDVLYTGRTIRAALDALTDFGRPRAVQLAVMVDRGHRELPIRPDYVGKNLPTRRDEVVDVTLESVQLGEMHK